MLQDYQLGEHLLLIGNQGVGKNKLIDHMLRLLNRYSYPLKFVETQNRDNDQEIESIAKK